MFQFFRQKLVRKEAVPEAHLPAGQRVYAVGDIHGRRDLFDALIHAVERDNAERGLAETTVVLLGDLVDRGPESAGVLALTRLWREYRDVRILGGNHEEMFLRSFDDPQMFRHFLRHGGRETVLSYGVKPRQFDAATLEEAHAMMLEAVPAQDRAFIESFEDMIEIGDYLFVHAGIAPGVALAEQKRHDLRWIREPFLSHSNPHGLVVVHGHTIRPAPEDKGNRIGIDTGAYASGRLTALALEGSSRRFIEAAQAEDGSIRAGEAVIP